MIWIREKDEIVGYVPILKKEYSENEIREMSKYCHSRSKGWSKLSRLVMKIQGISYAYIQASTISPFEAPFTLYDVKSDFSYECFLDYYSDSQVKSYIHQIFDVFENLTLYKVEHHSISQLSEKVSDMCHYLSRFVKRDIANSVMSSFEDTLEMAGSNAKYIEDLFKLFADNSLILSHNIFEEANDEILEKVHQQRDNLSPQRLIKCSSDKS